jgi:hypothetical protein
MLRYLPPPLNKKEAFPTNRIGETGLIPVSSFHTTVRTVRYTAVP